MSNKENNRGKTKFHFSINGMSFTIDEMPHIVLGRPVIDATDNSKLYVTLNLSQ